ncbi:hypothetical protein ACMHYB_08805 [Sorangium sp. So ce1128]
MYLAPWNRPPRRARRAWVAVEVATPLVFCALYWLLVQALGRVASDHHGCEGDLP